MPPRTAGQPENAIDRYRQRLNDEMEIHGETDRSLADKLEKRGYPIHYSSLNKTRKGTRQPSLDECINIALAFGYASLDGFLNGTAGARLDREWAAFMGGYVAVSQELRDYAHDRARDLYLLTQDDAFWATLAEAPPGWWRDWVKGRRSELRFLKVDLDLQWQSTIEAVEAVLERIEAIDSESG